MGDPTSDTFRAFYLEIQRNGSDLNYRNEQGRNILHYAALFNKIRTVQTAFTKGTTQFLQDGDLFSPVHLAAYAGSLEILIYFLKMLSDEQLLLTNASTQPKPSQKLLTQKQMHTDQSKSIPVHKHKSANPKKPKK